MDFHNIIVPTTLEKLNAIKLGREYRVYEEDLIKFENERKTIPSK